MNLGYDRPLYLLPFTHRPCARGDDTREGRATIDDCRS
jgi:hypothetical protein